MELTNLNEWSGQMQCCRNLIERLKDENLFNLDKHQTKNKPVEIDATLHLINSSLDNMQRFLMHNYFNIGFRNHVMKGNKCIRCDAYFITSVIQTL